jgi:hypothetical protein
MRAAPPIRSLLLGGKKAVTIWVDPLVADQLKEIAFLHRKSQQAFFREALNILFAKYNKPQIAE